MTGQTSRNRSCRVKNNLSRRRHPATPDGDSLPLPLPPPPQNSGSLQPGAAEPASQQVASTTRSDNQEGAAGVEPAASAVSSGPISRPPVPRRKPRNLVASVQNAPTTQFQPVLQPAPQPVPQPQPLPQIAQPVPPQQGAIGSAAPQPQTAQACALENQSRGRDDDPLAGTRRPFNSSAVTQQQSGPAQLAPAPAPAQQQVALAPPPAPAPAPQPQQPVTSQDLQAFAPPSTPQSPPSTSGGSGYVIQLAAYRSEQEAMAQYQQLKSRHGNLAGQPAAQCAADQPRCEWYVLPFGNGANDLKARRNRPVQQAHCCRRARLPRAPQITCTFC
jgi:hypothetical protein